MSTWVYVVIAIAIVVLLVLGFAFVQNARRARLRKTFGPEYDRAVDRAGDRKAGERELVDRKKEHSKLTIRPLSATAAAGYRDSFARLQERFVDIPAAAVSGAHDIVTRAMADCGFPTTNDDTTASMLALEHGSVVEQYRSACDVYAKTQTGNADVASLRDAMLGFRAVLDRLLAESGQTGTEAYPAGEDVTPQPQPRSARRSRE